MQFQENEPAMAEDVMELINAREHTAQFNRDRWLAEK